MVADPSARPKSDLRGADRCGPLRAQNRAKLAAAPETAPVEQGGLKLAEACYPTPAGAWGLRLLSWASKPGDPYPAGSGRLEVVHFVAAAEVSWPMASGKTPAGVPIHAEVAGYTTLLDAPRLVDVDGDGEPELFFRLQRREHEGTLTTEATLLTVRAGSVQPFGGLPEGVDFMDDVDHDGRMDFLYHPYEQHRDSPCSGFVVTWPGPALLAHGLAGGRFSTDDDVALAYARRSCPTPPGAAGAAPAGDDEAPPELCARLWGQSEEEALRVLRAQCRPVKKGGDMCRTAKGECAEFDDREHAVRQVPPVRLR